MNKIFLYNTDKIFNSREKHTFNIFYINVKTF